MRTNTEVFTDDDLATVRGVVLPVVESVVSGRTVTYRVAGAPSINAQTGSATTNGATRVVRAFRGSPTTQAVPSPETGKRQYLLLKSDMDTPTVLVPMEGRGDVIEDDDGYWSVDAVDLAEIGTGTHYVVSSTARRLK